MQNYIKLIHRNQKRLINTIFFLLNCHLVFTTEDFIRIFDVSSGEYEDIHVSDNISEDLNCSLLLEDKYFVTWGRVCGAIRIWDSKTGKCLKKLSIKSQRSREKFCGDLVKLNDGRLVCFNIDGVHLFNFPKFPENNLKNTPSKNIVSYPNKNCKQM